MFPLPLSLLLTLGRSLLLLALLIVSSFFFLFLLLSLHPLR